MAQKAAPDLLVLLVIILGGVWISRVGLFAEPEGCALLFPGEGKGAGAKKTPRG